MPQVQLAIGDVQPAPLDYVVPGAQEISPVAVNATFDGTSAVTAWLPALELISDSGHVISRTFPASSVAAGGTAEVTFAPFLRQAAAAGAATQGMAALATGQSSTCAADGVQRTISIQNGVNFSTVWLAPTSMFEPVHRVLFGIDTYGVKCKTPGTYRVDANLFASGGTVGRQVDFFYLTWNGNEGQDQLGRTAYLVGDRWDPGTSLGWSHCSFTEWQSLATGDPPMEIYLLIRVALGGGPAVTIQAAQVYVSYVADLEVPAGSFW